MTRIAFISTLEGVGWGGSEELWSRSAVHFAQSGCEVTAAVNPWPEPVRQHERLEKAGIRIDSLAQSFPPGRSLARRVVDRIRRQRYHWLDTVRPDFAVFSLSGHQQGLAWLQDCLRREIPYAIIVQAVTEAAWPDEPTRARTAEAYEKAAAAYYVSQGNLELVRGMLATPLANAEVVHNPFNVSYDASPPWPGGEEEALLLACVGRLHPFSKGQDLIFAVLAQEAWRSRPVRLRLYGNGPDRAALDHAIAMYGLTNVEFAGFTPDVESIWADNHALILPSRFEGLPLAVVEAMLCSRPCIVTDIAGNAEHMEDGVSGFVAPGARIHYLADAMERCWRRRSDLRAIGEAAGRHVRARVPRDPAAELTARLAALMGRAPSVTAAKS